MVSSRSYNAHRVDGSSDHVGVARFGSVQLPLAAYTARAIPAMLDGPHRDLRPAAQPKLAEDVLDVVGHRPLDEGQAPSNNRTRRSLSPPFAPLFMYCDYMARYMHILHRQ